MATLSTLTIELDANSAKLVRELAKAKKKTGKFGKSVKKAAGQSAKAFAAVGAAVAAVTVLMVKNSLTQIDALAKTADQLGINTKELAGLHHAAKISGVAEATLNKALVKQQKALFDANRGLATYAQHFDKLGLSTESLMKMNAADQFKAIADELIKIEDRTTQTAIAYDVWGGKGIGLLNTIRDGSAGLEAMTAEAEALGIAVSRIDAAKIEAANDAMVRAGSAVAGIGNKITIELAPFITAASDMFTEAALNGTDMGAHVTSAMSGLASTIGFVSDVIRGIGVAFRLAEAIGISVSAGIVTVFSKISGVITGITDGILMAAEAAFKAGAQLPEAFGGGAFKEGVENVREMRVLLAGGVKSIDDFTNKVKGEAAAAWESFHELAMQPLPSEKIDAWLDELRGRAEVAAQATAAAIAAGQASSSAPAQATGFGGVSSEGLEVSLAEQLEIKQRFANSEALIQQQINAAQLEGRELTNEALLEMAALQARAVVIAEFEADQAAKGELGIPVSDEQRLALQAAFEKKQLALAMKFSTDQTKAKAKGVKDRIKLAAFEQKKTGEFQNTMVSGLKTFFGKSKAVQMAAAAFENREAIISATRGTITGMAKALEWGWPMGPIFAAAIGAVGFGYVASLAGLGGGGGGGAEPSSTSGGGSMVTSPDFSESEAEPGQVGAGSVRAIHITIAGDVIGIDDFTDSKLIPALENAITERDVVFINQESRQASELAGATA